MMATKVLKIFATEPTVGSEFNAHQLDSCIFSQLWCWKNRVSDMVLQWSSHGPTIISFRRLLSVSPPCFCVSRFVCFAARRSDSFLCGICQCILVTWVDATAKRKWARKNFLLKNPQVSSVSQLESTCAIEWNYPRPCSFLLTFQTSGSKSSRSRSAKRLQEITKSLHRLHIGTREEQVAVAWDSQRSPCFRQINYNIMRVHRRKINEKVEVFP